MCLKDFNRKENVMGVLPVHNVLNYVSSFSADLM